MAIDAWWAGQGEERYWMEVTDRDRLGDDLMAPQYNPTGKEIWSYSLVQYTEPGDIVFHWHKTLAGEPAIVGWSEVTGPLATDSMEWQARGTFGRARGRADQLPNWVMPLGGLHEFDKPITRSMLNRHISQVVSALDGKRYGAFYQYRPGELRAAQAYLTKFPAALVPLVRELSRVSVPTPPDTRTRAKASSSRVRQGRMSDTALRLAVEAYAVKRAIDHYAGFGATEIEVLGKPYDLKVMLNGRERHVEVKGTTADSAARVVVTVGEVKHAHDWDRTDLFVVDGIKYETKAGGEYELSGGSSRLWSDWTPGKDALHPTEFSYDLPDSGAELLA